ncbi:hypothetical protein B4N84_21790 [Flavobacterium sp. IR1]|nr:hypothetical protein B4N84_21790 [Flavobacterium sp. IR1]
MKNFTLAVALLITFSAQSQIGMGTPNPDPSAVLELASTQKGFLPPRLTTLQRDAIVHPPVGLTIFNTIKNCLEWYNISGWYNACGDNPVALANYTCDTLETGTMTEGIPVSGVSQTITAAVSSPGSYDISTTNNGVTFSAKGYFTSKGNHDVILHAKGTPIAHGFHTFTISGTATCSFGRSVNLSPAIVSSYSCNTANSGTMVVGTAVSGITQTITATVTKIGAYSITTNTVNGVTFSASGTFSSTGYQDVILTATGTPIAIGFDKFTLNTTPGCSFDRPTIDANTVVGKANKIWMAYNLGATKVPTAPDDTAQYGDLYQWGRATDGHEKTNSLTTTTRSNTDTPVDGKFIIMTAAPLNWRSSANNKLWQGGSGANNPCPAGFRIPTIQEFKDEISQSKIGDVKSAFYNTPLKLVAAGHRDLTNGNLGSVGVSGFYWSSDLDRYNNAYILMIYGGGAGGNSTYYPAMGLSVRCIKD